MRIDILLQMFPHVKKCIDELMTVLDEKCNQGKLFDLHA